MKIVFENRMVAHVWAQQNQYEGRSSNSQFYFRDKTIFSYRDSWPLATFINQNEVLLNTQRVSVTTSKHLGYVRQALKSDVKIWNVDCSIIKNPDAFLKLTPKKREKFLDDMSAEENAEIKEYKKRQAKQRREITKAEKAGAIVALQKWRNHEELSYGENRLIQKHKDDIALRLKDKDTVETSKGATMPVKFAAKIWTQVKKCIASKTEWKKNGHRLPAGHFEIDTISPEGDITAGCHFVKLAEVSDLAYKIGLK